MQLINTPVIAIVMVRIPTFRVFDFGPPLILKGTWYLKMTCFLINLVQKQIKCPIRMKVSFTSQL